MTYKDALKYCKQRNTTLGEQKRFENHNKTNTVKHRLSLLKNFIFLQRIWPKLLFGRILKDQTQLTFGVLQKRFTWNRKKTLGLVSFHHLNCHMTTYMSYMSYTMYIDIWLYESFNMMVYKYYTNKLFEIRYFEHWKTKIKDLTISLWHSVTDNSSTTIKLPLHFAFASILIL